GVRERLAALDDRVAGDPAAAPDECPGLVVATPHEAAVRRDRVCPGAADQRGKDRSRVPAGGTHPDDLALRPDQGTPLPVRGQRIIPEHVWRELASRWPGHGLPFGSSAVTGYPGAAATNGVPGGGRRGAARRAGAAGRLEVWSLACPVGELAQ